MIAAAPSASRMNCSMPCASSIEGDYTADQLKGAWAGEISQTQFLPSSFVKFAVDFDGNGQRRPHPFGPRRPGLHRQLPAWLRLAARWLRDRGLEKLRSPQGVEQIHPSTRKTISVFATRLMGE